MLTVEWHHILLLLHIGQTILYGSYKGRRELLWLSGCILLALMLGMAFTGYLLPWTKKAYFASAVGTNLIAEVHGLGRHYSGSYGAAIRWEH